MDSKGEVLLTIMASLAQQESQSLSQNIKLGLQYRFQNGEVRVNHSRFLGYTKDEEGNLIIEPAEAEVVKRIYRGVPGRSKPAPDWARPGSRWYSYRGRENEVAPGNTEEDPAE